MMRTAYLKRVHWSAKLALGVCIIAVKSGASDVAYSISGQGWVDYGRVIHSTDTLLQNLNGNDIQGPGAQFTAKADFGSQLEGAFGIGGFQYHDSPGNDVQAKLMKFYFRNFITEARITYYAPDKSNPSIRATFGNFNYNYNSDIKNLGQYLLRGSVYPGFLTSGFQHPSVDDTRSDVLGINLNHRYGFFSHDLIFANERDLPPSFDWSLAYVAKLQWGSAFTLGAGVNFHRLLSANSKLTSPGPEEWKYEVDLVGAGGYHPYDGKFIEVDTSNSAGNPALWDTIAYTHKGVKLMGMLTFDIKQALGLKGAFGKEDLKFYSEAALIGVKNYGSIYADRLQRIPVMFGFNAPTFGILDVMSLEVEWYGAKYRNDIAKLGPTSKFSDLPSPIPVSYKQYEPIRNAGGVDPVTGRLYENVLDSAGNPVRVAGPIQIRGTALDIQNLTQDNWKWSLFAQKTLRDHIRFTAQVANDHTRPQPRRESPYEVKGGTAESFSSLRDWYFMLRLGYFF